MAKKPVEPKSVEELVRHALKLAATNPSAKWTGATPAALFSTKDTNHAAAIEACTKPDAPLLKPVGKGGALTAAGFERIAGELSAEEARGAYDHLREELPDDQVGAAARAMARCLPPGARVEFVQGVIRRTPLAATELTPVLEEAIAQEKVEQEKRVAAAAKRHAADEAAKRALERAKELIEERQQNRRDALRREYEAEGGDPSELQAPAPKGREPEKPAPKAPAAGTAPRLKTSEETDFRRDVAKQLAEMWRVAWNEKKDEGRDYLESAMWNMSGLKMIGEPHVKLPFDGRYHECSTAVFTGDQVRVVRPGWMVEEGPTDYVAIKAVVEKL